MPCLLRFSEIPKGPQLLLAEDEPLSEGLPKDGPLFEAIQSLKGCPVQACLKLESFKKGAACLRMSISN